MNRPLKHAVATYDHSTIPSVDLIWDLEFYEDLFGAELLERSRGRHRLKGERPPFVNFATRPIKQGRCPIVFMDIGGSVWGLFLQLDYPPAAERMQQGPRHGFSILRKDLDSALDALRALEVEFEGPVDHEAESPIETSVYFKDPSGNSLELCIERNPPSIEPQIREGARINAVRLYHLVLDVEELDRAEDVYIAALGLEPLYRGTTPDGLAKSVLRFPTGQIMTLQNVPAVTERNAWKTMGKIHSGLVVHMEDWNEVEKRLVQRGFEIMPDFVKNDDYRLDDQKSIYFADHDNNIIQLFTPKPFGR